MGEPSFEIEDLERLTIEGQDAELVGSDLTMMFMFRRVRDLTIRNLRIDWDPLPFSGGRVVALTDDYCDLEAVAPHTVQAGVRGQAILEYDPVNHRLVQHGRDAYQRGFPRLTEEVAPGIMRVPLQYPKWAPRLGKWGMEEAGRMAHGGQRARRAPHHSVSTGYLRSSSS